MRTAAEVNRKPVLADRFGVHNCNIKLSAFSCTTAVLRVLLLGGSWSAEDLWFEEIGVADGRREGGDEEIAEVHEAIRQLEEFRRELKRLRRFLEEPGKAQIQQSKRSLNSAVSSRASYIS